MPPTKLGLILIGLALLLAARVIPASAAQQPPAPRVVVTSKPIHALVAAVMDGIAKPALLVDGRASPHTFAMKPSDALKVHQAQLFFRVSETLEPFTRKLMRSLPPSVVVITLAAAPGMRLLPRRRAGAFEPDERDREHAHSDDRHRHRPSSTIADAADPHVWLDPGNAKAMTDAIVAALLTLLPSHEATLRTNAASLRARIDQLTARLELQLNPLKGRPFLVSHDAFQYFERRFDLTAVGSITLNPDERPSARRLTELRRKVRTLRAVCVFAEPGVEKRLVASVIEGTTARTVRLDPEGIALASGPELYFTLMKNLADAARDCLAPPNPG